MEIPSGMPELIAEEAKDAMKYAELAAKHRTDHPDLSEMFMALSGEELRHMKMLSEKMTSMVEAMHTK